MTAFHIETLLLGADAVEDHAAMPAVIDAVSAAFAADARDNTVMPAKSYIDLPQYNGDFRSMPAYIDATEGAGEAWEGAGVKWVNSHPENPERHDLPTVASYHTLLTERPEHIFDSRRGVRLATEPCRRYERWFYEAVDLVITPTASANRQPARLPTNPPTPEKPPPATAPLAVKIPRARPSFVYNLETSADAGAKNMPVPAPSITTATANREKDGATVTSTVPTPAAPSASSIRERSPYRSANTPLGN
jgi:hypothetical protein